MTKHHGSGNGLNEDSALIAVCVGNSTTQVALFASPMRSSEPSWVRSCAASDLAQAERIIRDADAEVAENSNDAPRLIAIASVNAAASRPLEQQLKAKLAAAVVSVPEDLPVPIRVATDPDAKTGVDRLLAAAAAFETIKQACAVVDAGTAMTVNFVDGEGTFQGGVIVPGIQMALNALHEHTAALPVVKFQTPAADQPFPKNTTQAMLHGVFHGARGLVRAIIERYAEAYEAYPTVIACGGDANALFADDAFVDRVVPDLVLRGIALAFRRAAGEPIGSEVDD